MIYFLEMVGIFFQRPMILGYYSAILGLIIFLFCIIFSFLFRERFVKKDDIKIYIICLIFVFVSCVNDYFLGAGFDVIKSFFIGFLTVTSLSYVFLNYSKKSRNIFKYSFGFLIFSTFFTILLSKFDVNEFSKFSYLSLPLKDRSDIDEFNILYPVSTIPWRMTVGDIILPRATYFAIEPGVGVFLVMLWRYLCLEIDGFKSIICDIIFVLGLLVTASTTMPLMLVCWFAGRYFYKNKIFNIYNNSLSVDFKRTTAIIIFIIIGAYLFLYMPYFGYMNKIHTHGESFEIREELYSSETGIFRYFRILLLVVFYFMIRKFISKSFFIIYFAMCAVSLLNVFAFTPLFFLSVFLSKRTSS